jgi:hypothetical protein
MKRTFHIDEDIGRIKTGDTVLISGLYGKNFKFINNKVGKIKNTFYRVEDEIVIPLANVTLDENGKDYVINFDFLYKLDFNGEIVDGVSQHIFTIENSLLFYIHKKSIRELISFQDEMSQCVAMGIDKNSKYHLLLFSGIN